MNKMNMHKTEGIIYVRHYLIQQENKWEFQFI